MSAVAPLVLVDGSSYLYRAFHALPALSNAKGQPTGAVKGVINMLRRLQKDFPGSQLAVIFDAKGKTFRSDLYAQYKANRPPMPDDLRAQIEPIHAIVEAMGLPLLVVEGVEADDVIGTLARQASAASHPVVVSTGDKDMAQLVDQQTTLVNTMTETTLDREGVIDKFGLPPELIIDFLALMGDKVDNIPGVAGVGEKTALALLQHLGGLDDIYQNLDAVAELPVRGAGKLGEKLRASEDDARLSYRLATIKDDVELPFSIEQLLGGQLATAADNDRLATLFQELEFKSWSEELAKAGDGGVGTTAAAKETDYQTVLDKKALDSWIARIKKAGAFAFDTETTSLDYSEADIVGVSVAVSPYEAAYIPFGHSYDGAPKQLAKSTVLKAIRPLLESEDIAVYGQNLKYDMHIVANEGIEIRGIGDDTMLMSYILNSTSNRHDMDSLAFTYLGAQTTSFEEVAGKGAKQISFDQVALEQAAPYAAEDADITLRLQQTLREKLAEQPDLEKLYRDIELPVMRVIQCVEANGALIDSELLAQQSKQLSKRLQEIETEAYELAGEEFNLGSPKQLQAILFEKLQLPVLKKTPKGQPSTAEPVLQELALDYPLPKLLMEHRSLAKLRSTYTDSLPNQVSARTGRVHTSYHQAVTATGRLSSTDPNLQNIPIRTAEGRKVRQAFVAPEGMSIVAADYSQIELRIMAHLSGDSGLVNAFKEGLDIHRATAAEVFGIGIAEVSDEQRRRAKAINFGLIYGMSAFGLGRQLGIGRNDAQDYIDRYFERYPGVLEYMDRTRKLAAEQGYVETLFGRRLYLAEINSNNGMRRQAAERTAINAPMQGTAADIIKLAMLAVDQWIVEQAPAVRMIMQVHDELVFEVPNELVDKASQDIAGVMAAAASLDVPLVVDAGSGQNWDEAH